MWYYSMELIVPISVGFFVNMAVVFIASKWVYGSKNAKVV